MKRNPIITSNKEDNIFLKYFTFKKGDLSVAEVQVSDLLKYRDEIIGVLTNHSKSMKGVSRVVKSDNIYLTKEQVILTIKTLLSQLKERDKLIESLREARESDTAYFLSVINKVKK